ncbi:MAG TPA: hypothetical protein DDZ83_18800 [Nitrospinae bacterium]|nr:hypothetical protein [Nitrospinota bacterium]
MESNRVYQAEKLSPGISCRLVKGRRPAWCMSATKARIRKMLDFYQKRYGFRGERENELERN